MRKNLLALGAFGSRSRLRGRIEALLAHGRVFGSASPSRAAASAAALLALAIAASFAPRWIALAQSIPSFEVASVKLNKSGARPLRSINAVPASGRLVIRAMSVKEVIQGAYGVQSFEIVNTESPVLNERVDIDAKAAHPVASAVELQRMLQPLLAERFKLAVHRETRETNALALRLANRNGELGPKMKQTNRPCDALGTAVTRFALADPVSPGVQRTCGIQPAGAGRIVAGAIDLPTLVGLLAPSQRRSVVDQTGLQGRYDIDVTYTPEIFTAAALAQRGATLPPGVDVDPNGPPLFEALREQLGLSLEPKRLPVPVVVIDHIEPLIEN
jgi:uncharacterized protein (TIGR03435 family)